MPLCQLRQTSCRCLSPPPPLLRLARRHEQRGRGRGNGGPQLSADKGGHPKGAADHGAEAAAGAARIPGWLAGQLQAGRSVCPVQTTRRSRQPRLRPTAGPPRWQPSWRRRRRWRRPRARRASWWQPSWRRRRRPAAASWRRQWRGARSSWACCGSSWPRQRRRWRSCSSGWRTAAPRRWRWASSCQPSASVRNSWRRPWTQPAPRPKACSGALPRRRRVRSS